MKAVEAGGARLTLPIVFCPPQIFEVFSQISLPQISLYTSILTPLRPRTGYYIFLRVLCMSVINFSALLHLPRYRFDDFQSRIRLCATRNVNDADIHVQVKEPPPSQPIDLHRLVFSLRFRAINRYTEEHKRSRKRSTVKIEPSRYSIACGDSPRVFGSHPTMD
jgi:hypothetical protein